MKYFELFLYFFVLILLKLVQSDVIYNIFFVIISSFIGIYFFPIKLIFYNDKINIVANFLISFLISISVVSIFIELNFLIKSLILIILLVNFYLIYYYNKINSYYKYLCLISVLLISAIFFK